MLWTDPGGDCDVTKYMVEFQKTENDQCTDAVSAIFKHFTNNPWFVIMDLEVFTNYRVFVTAISDDASGPRSNKLCIETDEGGK